MRGILAAGLLGALAVSAGVDVIRGARASEVPGVSVASRAVPPPALPSQSPLRGLGLPAGLSWPPGLAAATMAPTVGRWARVWPGRRPAGLAVDAEGNVTVALNLQQRYFLWRPEAEAIVRLDGATGRVRLSTPVLDPSHQPTRNGSSIRLTDVAVDRQGSALISACLFGRARLGDRQVESDVPVALVFKLGADGAYRWHRQWSSRSEAVIRRVGVIDGTDFLLVHHDSDESTGARLGPAWTGSRGGSDPQPERKPPPPARTFLSRHDGSGARRWLARLPFGLWTDTEFADERVAITVAGLDTAFGQKVRIHWVSFDGAGNALPGRQVLGRERENGEIPWPVLRVVERPAGTFTVLFQDGVVARYQRR